MAIYIITQIGIKVKGGDNVNSMTAYFVIVGSLAAVSLTCGLLGYGYYKHATKKVKREKPSTFREVYEDNAPKRSDSDLMNEYLDDMGRDYPY